MTLMSYANRRHRSGCASAQPDLGLRCPLKIYEVTRERPIPLKYSLLEELQEEEIRTNNEETQVSRMMHVEYMDKETEKPLPDCVDI